MFFAVLLESLVIFGRHLFSALTVVDPLVQTRTRKKLKVIGKKGNNVYETD